MAWTTPRTYTTGEVITKAILDTHVRDNLNETAPAKVTTAGDLVQATGANALARLGIGTAGQVLQVNAGATAAAWATLLATPEVLFPIPPLTQQAAPASQTISSDTAYLVMLPPLDRNITITKIVLNIATSSGNLDVGVYSTTDGATFTRVVSLGSTASPGTGQQKLDIADTALSAGTRYGLAFAFDNGTAAFYRQASFGMLLKASSFPLPASLTSMTQGSDYYHGVYGLVSGGSYS